MNDMMSSTDNLVYIIDETYHIVHFNDVLQDVYPEMHSGDTCYEVLCGNSSPCRKCPLAEWNASTVEMYNEKLKCWVELNTGKIDWPGKGACSIIISRNHTGKKAIKFSISAEYAMIPRQGNTFDELYRKADTALFAAKMNGKSTFVQYDSGMKEVRPELADPEKTPE
ncbi:hypothetical protein [Faecalicatena contorta]|uniref:hypothetical protein n=1 Tax=Faecalicatena contorta TaxID=39482 RepID=UPI00189AAFBE|nr:hypothetical protein [Faecalicatena contorta]